MARPVPVPKAQLRFLLGRVHVATPDRDVVRDLYRRFRRHPNTKAWRKRCYRFALKCHHANLSLYRHVMKGR